MDWRIPPQEQIPARSESRKLPLDTGREALSQPEEARLHRGPSGAGDLTLSGATDSLEASQMPRLLPRSSAARPRCVPGARGWRSRAGRCCAERGTETCRSASGGGMRGQHPAALRFLGDSGC